MAHLIDAPCNGLPPRRASLWSRLWQQIELNKQRRGLSKLPPHILRDIGLSADEARKEANRPLWDVPSTWRD